MVIIRNILVKHLFKGYYWIDCYKILLPLPINSIENCRDSSLLLFCIDIVQYLISCNYEIIEKLPLWCFYCFHSVWSVHGADIKIIVHTLFEYLTNSLKCPFNWILDMLICPLINSICRFVAAIDTYITASTWITTNYRHLIKANYKNIFDISPIH